MSPCSLVLLVCLPAASEKPELRDLFQEQYDVMFYGTEKNSTAGFSVLLADVHGDGMADVCVGAPAADGPRKTEKIDDAGAVYLIWGQK